MSRKQGSLLGIVLVFLSQLAAAQEFIGIHCGSDEDYTGPLEEVYFADAPYSEALGHGYSGGLAYNAQLNELLGGTEDKGHLYTKVRRADFSYQIDLPAGLYAVKLMLADISAHGPGFNSMTIVIEDETVIEGLDLCEEVGRAFALPIRFLADVSDDQLTIDFISDHGFASCAAIAVYEVESDLVPPAVLTGFEVIGGYEQNILLWDYCTESDFAGYRVYRQAAGGEWELITDDPYPFYRYLDNDAAVGTEYRYYVTAVDHWGNESEPTEQLSATAIANAATDLARTQIFIGEPELYNLNARWWEDTYVDASFIIEGSTFPSGEIRYRGNYTRNLSKKNYKLKLPAGASHNGRDRINLNAEMVDYSMMKARISYDAYDLLDIPNPETRDVHLEINGEYRGVYIEMENVDNHFLERRGFSPAGNLYKAESNLRELSSYAEYQQRYPKQNNSDSQSMDIVEFITWLNNVPDNRFRDEALERMAMDEFLNMYAVVIATAELDFGAHNYYMYSNPVDGKWYFIPWDHNTSLSDDDSPLDIFSVASPSPIAEQTNILIDRVVNESLFRYAYCKKLERFVEGEFSFENVRDRILQRYDAIMFDAVRDVYKNGWERTYALDWGPGSLTFFAQQRIPFLLAEIPNFISDPDRGPEFRLNEVMLVNVSAIADEAGDFDPWVEVVNTSSIELDLSGFTLHFGEDSWSLTDDIVLPANGFALLWLDGEPEEGANHCVFRAGSNGGALRLEGNCGTQSDSVFVPELDNDQALSREENASGAWIDYAEPTPGTANSPSANPAVIVINELQAVNSSTVRDNGGDYDDWIEIYNPAGYAVELAGLYLSDNITRPLKWAFPDTILEAHSYLLVWCDEEPEEGLFHSTFKLSGDGEQVVLTDRDAVTVIDQVSFGEQESGHSYGRRPDGGSDWFELEEPTPGGTNTPKRIPDNIDPELPTAFKLHQNYPNPFNSATAFRFDLSDDVFVSLTVFDITGRQVHRLIDRELNAGEHHMEFDSGLLASGVYFYRLQAGPFVDTKKMVVVK